MYYSPAILRFNRSFFLSALICLLPALSAVPASAGNRVLLIGVSDYNHPMIQDLDGVALDIQIMRDVVRQLGFKDNEVKTLVDSQATLAAIEREIGTWLVSGVGSNDRVLLYYSGHGTQVPDTDGDEADGLDEALVPWDTDVQGDAAVNVLTDDRFNELLQRIPARETFVLIDACHSGTATKGISLIEDNLEVKFMPWPGVSLAGKGRFEMKESGNGIYIALAACRDNEEALSDKRLGSLFTLGLQQAVAGNVDQDLTLSELEDKSTAFIQKQLHDRKSRIHHPKISGNRELASANMFVQTKDNGSSPEASTDLWNDMVALVDAADYSFNITTNKRAYQVNDLLSFSMTVARDGYLNIINLGRTDQQVTILYPNRFHQENRVQAGQQIAIPRGNEFILRAKPPRGDNLIIALVTDKPLNLWQTGIGQAKDLFKYLDAKKFRSFAVEAAEPDTPDNSNVSLGGAKIVTTIE